jgi:Fe-S-cluster containining protein
VSSAAEAARKKALASLRALHADIDREAGRVAEKHAERLRCHRGCSACCVDELTIAPVEAERIRRAHPELLRSAKPHPAGACAFLDSEGSCRIYADRPSVCRSQGLPLRFFFEDEQDEIQEGRDICPLNLESGPPLDSLEEADFWLVGPHELRLTAIDDAFSSETAGRIRLRDLFEETSTE